MCVGWCGVGFICVRLGFIHSFFRSKNRTRKAESRNEKYYGSYIGCHTIPFISLGFMLRIEK